MVGAREAAFAHLALEGLGTSVFPDVTRQLVGAGEAPLAGLVVTAVGFFACVYALVGLQVRALSVRLATVREVAEMCSAFLQVRVVFPVVFDGRAAGVSLLGLLVHAWVAAQPGGGDVQHVVHTQHPI